MDVKLPRSLQPPHQDAEPALNLIEPGGVLWDVDKANPVSGVTQEGSTGCHRLQDTRFTLDPQVDVKVTASSNQAHQRSRFVDVELVNDKNPCRLWVSLNGVGDVVGVRHIPKRVAPIEGVNTRPKAISQLAIRLRVP